jgi:predicted metal-dependent HD superfamily phosphohydrolase
MHYSGSRKQHSHSSDSSARQAAEQALARVVLNDSLQALRLRGTASSEHQFQPTDKFADASLYRQCSFLLCMPCRHVYLPSFLLSVRLSYTWLLR